MLNARAIAFWASPHVPVVPSFKRHGIYHGWVRYLTFPGPPASSPEESGLIVAHENLFMYVYIKMYFSNGSYKTRSSMLADENAKCKLYLKGAHLFTACIRS